MLLKLVMPYFDRSAERGSVTRWHKSEGEWVRYGDTLLDVRIETVRFLKRSGTPRSILSESPHPEETYSTSGWDWLMRVTSSDVAVLRRIHAPEGSSWEIGGLLAVLNTEENEPIDESGPARVEASQFRVVVNPVESP